MTKKLREYLTRRQLLQAGAGLGTMVALGCGSGSDGGPDAALGPDALVPDLGMPEVSSALWQTMAAYVRASADGAIGTRINMFNPAPVPHRVIVQLLTLEGKLVAKDTSREVFAAGASYHFELHEFLAEHNVPLPFEGSLWIGTTPESGNSFMGLQGISFDWYGPAHLASVHGMRDFGNSGEDQMWTDLILPRVTVGPRYTSKIAVLNASADGISEALVARPQLIIRENGGAERMRIELPELAPYRATLLDVGELIGGGTLSAGSVQLQEPNCGLVAMGFLVDSNNDGFVTADHFFDRHFVVNSTGFTG